MPVFGTPTGTDLGALCRAHGIPHTRAGSAAELASAVAQAGHGIRVVEVTLPRSAHRAAHQRLRDIAAAALA
jgi:2-succinyl-5-enolpyruvyl-6-hydroxy-3-cyclohexene-1-carboxylate synthase